MADESASWRDHLANERTYLAWLRSALGVTVLGLAVARFGGEGGLAAGVVLFAVAVVGMAFGGLRYQRTRRAIEAGRLPGGTGTALMVAGAVLAVALVVAFLLVEIG